MVYYNPEALKDFENILYGLLLWPKHRLEAEHAKQYMRDMGKFCDSLDCNSFHAKSLYGFHKNYGDYVCRYKRNKNTVWYIIYNIDFYGNIWIEKITNNYLTME
ncbi:MAG: hypothetical protein LBP72_03100 [Dysgonamonadaceae bacterium]|jgi:hypothetical protein|nr:hypothetical protein [Dysgonamonadaceae bacterium]